jgi:group I intron endonuclease
MNTGVYLITNTANGKCYVGSAVNFRSRFSIHRSDLRRGMHHSAKLQRAWNKHSEAVFTFTPILVCAKDMLTFYEQRAMDVLKPEYNILQVARSSLGYKHSDDTRARLSVLAKSRPPRAGVPLSEDAKRRISIANTGRVASDATRAKLCEARRGKTPAKGMTHSSAAKAAVSLAHKGKKRDPAAVEAGAAKLRGVPRNCPPRWWVENVAPLRLRR